MTTQLYLRNMRQLMGKGRGVTSIICSAPGALRYAIHFSLQFWNSATVGTCGTAPAGHGSSTRPCSAPAPAPAWSPGCMVKAAKSWNPPSTAPLGNSDRMRALSCTRRGSVLRASAFQLKTPQWLCATCTMQRVKKCALAECLVCFESCSGYFLSWKKYLQL